MSVADAELRTPILALHGGENVDVPFSQIPPLVEAPGRSSEPGASVERTGGGVRHIGHGGVGSLLRPEQDVPTDKHES